MRQAKLVCALCAGALLVSMVVPVLVQAEVYRWEDSKGRVHYGDRSPKGVSASKVDMPVVPVTGGDDQGLDSEINDAERRQRQKRVVETLAAERKVREEVRQKKRDDKAKREAKCEKLRIELEESKRVNIYYRRNKKGERVFISDKERKQIDAKGTKKYQENCAH